MQGGCHRDMPRKKGFSSVNCHRTWTIALPRASCPQLAFRVRPLVALRVPLAVEVNSFPFSKLKALELLLGFVVLFTVALLSTTCTRKKLSSWNFTSEEMTARMRSKEREWKHNNNSSIFSPYMLPVFRAAGRQLFPSFHEKHTSIADLSLPFFIQLKTTTKQQFVLGRRRESRTRGFGSADATAQTRTEDARTMRSEHNAKRCSPVSQRIKNPLARQRYSAQSKLPALSNSWERNLENNRVLCAASGRACSEGGLFRHVVSGHMV